MDFSIKSAPVYSQNACSFCLVPICPIQNRADLFWSLHRPIFADRLLNAGRLSYLCRYMGIIVEFIRELNITMKDMKWTSLPVTGRSHFALQALRDRRGCNVRGRSKRAGDGVRDANACRIKLTKGILIIFIDKGTILTYIVCSKTKTNSRIIYHGCSNSR